MNLERGPARSGQKRPVHWRVGVPEKRHGKEFWAHGYMGVGDRIEVFISVSKGEKIETTVFGGCTCLPLDLCGAQRACTLFANKTSVHKCREGVPCTASGVSSVGLFLGERDFFGANYVRFEVRDAPGLSSRRKTAPRLTSGKGTGNHS